MLPWTRSKWFRRAVTGLSTVFVGVVLATSLLAEGSALKRHAVPYASIKCPKGTASGRARPQGGCAGGKAIVIKPKTKKGHRLPPLVVKSTNPAPGSLSSGKVNLTLGPKPKSKAHHH